MSVGWVAARAWGRTRNSYDHALWAHTSPVYVRDAPASAIRATAAAAFIEDIDRSLEWIRTQARFDATSQRDRIVDLFREGRRVYERLATN